MVNMFIVYVLLVIFYVDMYESRSLWNLASRRNISPFNSIIPIDMEMLDAIARIQFESSLLSNINTHQEVTSSRPTSRRDPIVGDSIPFGGRPRVKINPIDVTEPVGATVTLHCHVSGPRPHDIRWRRSDGRLLSARAVLRGQHRLTISRLDFRDSGRYICRAANRYGVTKRSAVVSVVDHNGNRLQRVETDVLRAFNVGDDT